MLDVTGRGRTCDAPRFRRALYRAELRSREDGGTEMATPSPRRKGDVMANRMVEKSRARARKAVAGRLEPGEEIEVLLFGVTRPSLWLDALISPLLVVLQRSWYVVMTNRRVFLVALSRVSARPSGVEWDEPRDGVRIEQYKRGVLTDKLFLRRVADGRVLKLRFMFRYRNEALRIKTALGT